MLRSYFRTAIRHIRRHRLYAFINIFGLATGFTAFLFITVFVSHELSYDSFHENSKRIIKVNLEFGDSPDAMHPVQTTPNALLPAFLDRFPEVIEGTRYFNPSSFRPPVVKQGDRSYHEKGFAYADSTFLDVFSFELLKGSEETALTKPYSVILTRQAAEKYFDSEDVLGRSIIISGKNFTITGLMEDIPVNSHIQFNMLASFATHPASRNELWGSANYFTYLTLESANSIESLRSKIPDLFTEVGYGSPDEGFLVNAVLVPLTDIYLYSEADALSDPSYAVIFSLIGLLIMGIAAVNYINLATARSAARAREVGIRKVSGAIRKQLFGQFISESIVVTALALILSFVLVAFLLPQFNQISGKAISIDYFLQPSVLVIVFAMTLLVAFGSGVYPALFLSSLKPVKILKGSGVSATQGILLRKLLVIGQFAVSIFLVIATLVVGDQLRFIQSKNLGYSNEAVIAIPVNNDLVESSDAVKSSLINSGVTSEVSFAGETPTQIRGGYSIWGQGMAEGKSKGITAVAVDEDYQSVLDLSLLAGDFINRQDIINARSEDRKYGFILNETAVQMLGWSPEEAIDKRVSMNGRDGLVKGVIADFHFNSLHQPVGPLALFAESKGSYNYMMVSIEGDLSEGISRLNESWNSFAPDYPFQYTFLDSELGALYESEQKLGVLFRIFSSIAVLIACLGLFGIASFIALQRSREFGVRKVLGASGKDIIGLVSQQFIYLIIIAFVVAAPLSYVVMDGWLSDFVYRTNVSPVHFLLALGGTILVSIVAISYHAIRSAMLNPTEVLKTE